MSDSDDSDWVEGGTLEAEVNDLWFFGETCVPVDPSGLPDNDEPVS